MVNKKSHLVATMRLTLKSSVVGTLIANLLYAPLSLHGYGVNNTKSVRPFASIAQASGALLDHAVATIGTTVYTGDTLQTSSTGSLVMQVRGAQVHLLKSTDASLENGDPGHMRVFLNYGTVKFASGRDDPVEIDCSDVAIRSRAELPASGLVGLISPNELLVQSIHGDFEITFDGITQTIASGKAYRALISQSTGTGDKNQATGMTNPHRDLKLAIVVAVTEGLVFLYINHILDESPSNPSR